MQKNWHKDFGFQEDTVAMLEITCYFIERYFGREDGDALIHAYFEKYMRYLREDMMSHDDPWSWATRIYFVMGLNGDHSGLRQWEMDNDWVRPPEEVLEYMRKNYWNF